MRQTKSKRVTPGDLSTHPLTFTAERGEKFMIDVLEDDLIRVRHYPDGKARLDRTWMVVGADGSTPRAGRARDIHAWGASSPFSQPEFTLTETDDAISLQTGALTLRIHTAPFYLEWLDASGAHFASDLPAHAYPYDRGGAAVFHFMQRRADEHYYGFGEKAGPLDKYGMRMKMENRDALGYHAWESDPLYKHWPFYITWVPELQIAYGLFYDNLANTIFDMGKEVNALFGPHRYYQAAGGDLDYYLIYGPGIADVVQKFTRLTGRPALLPRYALGYLGSTMHYTDAPDAGEQLKQFVDLCAEHDIPCDMFHLSSGYTTDSAGRRMVFNWAYDKIPRPQAMVDYFKQAGIQLSANIKPHLLVSHPGFAEVEAAGGFIKDTESGGPWLDNRWSSGIADMEQAAYLDFTNPAGYDWWKQGVTRALLEFGIASTWNDNNEFEVWDDDAVCDGFGNPIPAGLARPLHTLLMGRASYEALLEFKPDERPYVLTRAGCPGIQRYAQTWSGDNYATWQDMQYNTAMGLGLSLSGMGNTGHDVGGFYGDAPSPELFIRWVQNGIFYPRFTIHSLGLSGTATAPWMYPAALPLVRDFIRFRYQLIPYLYSLFVEQARTGAPVIRPLVYSFPQDAQTYTESFDFMFGPGLLVAGVFQEGQRERAVYLPAGADWVDYHTGEYHTGGQVIHAAAPLDRIPLFMRAGSILPLGKVMQHIRAAPDDVRQAVVFPAAGEAAESFTLVEDDGISMAYQQGQFTEVTLSVASDAGQVRLAARAKGPFPLAYDTVEFILPAGETRAIHAPGAAIAQDGQARWRVQVPVQQPT